MKKYIHILLLFFMLVLVFDVSFGQCAMCKAAIERSEDGEATIVGIKRGIGYLMLFPYIAMGAVGYFWYRNYKKNQKKQYS